MALSTRFSLNGEWTISYTDVKKGDIETALKNYKNGETYPCPVPGDIHMPLIDAGVIKDPTVDMNDRECRWLETKEFWYVKEFDIAEGFIKDKTIIRFDGLDCTADIWINDKYIGSHDNALVEVEFDISDVLKEGKNIVVVRIDNGKEAVKDKPLWKMDLCWNNDEPYRAWMRKPQFVNGWDWTLWLVTCGIWKGVTIESFEKAYIKDVFLQTDFKGVTANDGNDVVFNATVETEAVKCGDYTLNIKVYDDAKYGTGELVAEASAKAEEKTKFALDIKNAKLWWPNGNGNPHMYNVVVELLDENGNVLSEAKRRHGNRTVAIREEDLGDGQTGFTFIINGRPIFCKGANHVPMDMLLGRLDDNKTRKLIELAAKSNMNMLRVWGGGIYETDAFMEACDDNGIMVWHDFMFACGFHPSHVPEYYEKVKHEATLAIKRQRQHTSLIGWSGNNEIQCMYLGMRRWNKELVWYGGELYEQLFPELINELCNDRIYRESSPFGGPFADDMEHGDQHVWMFTHVDSYEHYLDLWRFTDLDLKFLSEFGIIGAMNIESARKCISPSKMNQNSMEWLNHTNSSQNHQLMNMLNDIYFGNSRQMKVQEFILKSQVIQGEIIRHIYDEFRSRKFHCSGLLFWTLGDSFGIHNWAIMDYWLGKRPVYYYLKRAQSVVNVCPRGYDVQNFDGMKNYAEHWKTTTEPVEIWVSNDHLLEEKEVEVRYSVITFDGKVLKSGNVKKTIAVNGVEKVAEVTVHDICGFEPENTVLYMEALCDGVVINENKYFFAPFKVLNLTKPEINCEKEKLDDTHVKLTLEANTFTWMLHIATPDGVDPENNDFDLIPGYKKSVVVTVENADSYNPELHFINPEQ